MSSAAAAEHSLRFISVEEYLKTRYRPDREYIDGQVKEKGMPTKLHGFVQIMIGRWFGNHMEEWGVAPESEVRTRVESARFRLPDVNIVPLTDSGTGTQDTPPIIAIEIRSDDSRHADLRARANDLRTMGVEHVWLIDPELRLAFRWNGTAWAAADTLRLPDSSIHLDLDWLWAQVDLRGNRD